MLASKRYAAEARIVREAMNGNETAKSPEEIARLFLVYKRWLRNLVDAWPNWGEQVDDWCAVAGEEHLRWALARSRGVVLLSGHDYGFNRLVPPVLARKGYSVMRTGMGREPLKRVDRWGENGDRRWEYINYHGDRWQRLKALNRMRQALEQSGIVHISITGSPRGDCCVEIPFWRGRFFLDAKLIRLLEVLEAPVCPCFATCGVNGEIIIKIHAPLSPEKNEVVTGFGRLYAAYLREFPEFSRIWSRVVREKEEF